jgi:hypothetical protein
MIRWGYPGASARCGWVFGSSVGLTLEALANPQGRARRGSIGVGRTGCGGAGEA